MKPRYKIVTAKYHSENSGTWFLCVGILDTERGLLAPFRSKEAARETVKELNEGLGFGLYWASQFKITRR